MAHLGKLRAHGKMSQPAQEHGENPKKEIDQPETYESGLHMTIIGTFQENPAVYMRSPFVHLFGERPNHSKAKDRKYLDQKSVQGGREKKKEW